MNRLFFVACLALAACNAASEDEATNDAGATDANQMSDAAVEVGDAGTAPDLALDFGEAPDLGADEDVADAGSQPEERLDVIVASGANHTLYTSVDEGLTWCRTNHSEEMTDFDNPFLFRNITYANGLFVAGSWRGIFSSPNGVDWTELAVTDNPAQRQWIAQIDYGNGWWVATGGYGTAMRSADLQTWEDVSDQLEGNDASRTLAFGEGVFVTGRDNVGWWESADGTSWAQRDADAGSRVVFDEAFIEHPGYDRGRGIRLKGGWPDQILRADDDDAAEFVQVATTSDPMTRFAFGSAPAADLAADALPDELADCLGL